MMLEIRDVKKKFDGHTVLDGISLDVEKGDVTAILGPSGSGKTTFLRCLNFLERADSGTLVFDGEKFDLHTARKAEIARVRKKTAFVFQNYNLFLNKTVLQNVTLGLTSGAGMKKEAANERAMKALAKVGMAEKTASYPSQLSGGQQQRVAIARALALNPDILCFDEPTSALDPELTGEVLSVIRSLASEKTTMIIVTPEMGFARQVADNVLFMDKGVVIEYGSPADVIDNPKHERTRQFLENYNNA